MPVFLAALGLVVPVGTAVAQSTTPPSEFQASESTRCCDCSCYGRYQSGGWQVYETKNFRLQYYGREQQLAELAKACEQSRQELRRTWLAIDDEAWAPKCDGFLYSNPADYSRCSGCPPDTRGTSNLEIGFGKVWNRRIHLRIDQPGYIEHVLPHELTHVVLADPFSSQQIPRWADEGIAMLNEPPQRRKELEQVLAKARRTGSTLPLRQLLTAQNHPPDQRPA